MSQLTVLVNKLGHNLEEIRSRALLTIVSKLDYGLIKEDELVDIEDLFQNLVKWFTFKNAPYKEEVLNLILRLLKGKGSDVSVLLLKADPGLSQLRDVSDCDILVQDIVNLTSKQVNSARYAPSEDNTPSEKVTKTVDTARTDKSKASSSTGYLHSVQLTKPKCLKPVAHLGIGQSAGKEWSERVVQEFKKLPTPRSNESPSSLQSSNKKESNARRRGEIWALPILSVVASDLEVISTVRDSLHNLSTVPKTCHFITSVMLHDFPPEVLLQNPGIIKRLMKLMKEPPPVSSSAVECLAVYTRQLHNRLVFISQLQFTTNRSQCDDVDSGGEQGGGGGSQGEATQQYQQQGYLSSSSDPQSPSKSDLPLSIPMFCLMSLTGAVQHLGVVEEANPLVLQTLSLYAAAVPDSHHVWEHKSKPTWKLMYELAGNLLDTLTTQIKRSVSHEHVVELHYIALGLLIIETLVPIDLAPLVLPTELQEIVCYSLVDPIVAINYPQLHSKALSYGTVLKRKGLLVHQEVTGISEAMKATVKFSQDSGTLPPQEALDLFHAALPALPFHLELGIIREFIQYVMERRELSGKEVDRASTLTRSLLAHSEKSIAAETYRLLHDVVTSSLGPRQAVLGLDPCPRLWFLIHTAVLVEIVCHGVNHPDNKISQYAEEMLVHILKCEVLVGERSWRRVVEQLTPVLPLLQCHASKSSALGRTALQMLDPDTSPLTSLQVLAGNMRLLFHRDPVCREEAATRLLWLARLSHLPHKRLSDVCLIDLTTSTHSAVTGMYEVGSVVRVLEVLSGPCVEVRVQQSALTQLSVMTEDSSLHPVFIENHGIELFIDLLKRVVVEMSEEAGRYIIPIVTTMKNLACHSPAARQTLSRDQMFLDCVLKSLFQLTEWRLQRDATQLLVLVLYADFVLSSTASISLPQLCVQSLCLPFPCQAHWTVSPNTTSSLRGVVLGHMGAERLLALEWAVLRQGLGGVLSLTQLPPERSGNGLRFPLLALRQVQRSHITHNCRLLLYTFQNATSHDAAYKALASLVCFLELSWLTDSESLSSLPWKDTFRRFLLMPPSCQDDFTLLILVLRFLHFLLGVSAEQSVWVSEALQTPPHTLLKLIVAANSAHVRNDEKDMWKKLCLWTLQLCKMCVKQGYTKGWQVLVQLILQCLVHHSHTEHLYSLATLDCKLECLLAVVGEETSNITILWQLLTAFHCEDSQSFMGLSITRHILLCLNKLLFLTKEWEGGWLRQRNLMWVLRLWCSRDVVVRAAALQLLAGLTRSSGGATTVLQLSQNLVDQVFRMVVDHTEASLVREHAALLLTNIVKISSSKEIAAVAQEVNFYREFREAVALVSLVPLASHTDPSSEMLYTHPRLVRAGCWLINNLLVASPDTLQLVIDSNLSTALLKTLSEVGKVESCDVVGMFGAVCKLLTHCGTSCEVILLQDSLPGLLRLLDPITFVHGSPEMTAEVKVLWQEAVRLLGVVLPKVQPSSVLPSPAVDTLCQCVRSTNTPALKLSALDAVPSATKYLAPEDEVAVCDALSSQWQSAAGKCRAALVAALTALLAHSATATEAALHSGLLALILTALHQLHLTLAVQIPSVDKIKKNSPGMSQLEQLLGLTCAFLKGSERAKLAAADAGSADLVHKLWFWCQADIKCLIAALNLLITLTADCPIAAGTLVLTSTVPGVGQRKSPTSHSMVHVLLSLLTREQQQPSQVRAEVLALLGHSCQAQECRTVIAKSALLTKWSDQWADKKQAAEEVELLWLKFILVFTAFPEGQTSVPKTGELFSQLIVCAESGRPACRPLALAILRNLAALAANKPRFLSTRPFLTLLGTKLLSGVEEEKRDTALIVWALVANHHKAKVALRGFGLVDRLNLVAATSQDDIFSFVANLLEPR